MAVESGTKNEAIGITLRHPKAAALVKQAEIDPEEEIDFLTRANSQANYEFRQSVASPVDPEFECLPTYKGPNSRVIADVAEIIKGDLLNNR